MPSKVFNLKKIIIPLAAAVLAVAVAVAVVLIITAPVPQNKAVAFVDGHPIYAGELMLAIEKLKSDTIMYFMDTYGVSQGKNFWEQEAGGENPREKLITDALELAARYKKEQIMMLDYGVITARDWRPIKRVRPFTGPCSIRSRDITIICIITELWTLNGR